MSEWASGHVGLHYIAPDQPWRNGDIGVLQLPVRDECLSINAFWSLTQAQVVISDWKRDYNHHHRRHSGIDL